MKLCECGCGQPVSIASKTIKQRGWIKGQPVSFVKGHSGYIRLLGITRYNIDPKTGCWNWQGSKTKLGYGRISLNGKPVMAHRFFYEMHKGKIPEGYTLDHLCRNSSCVNPDHLEPVLHAENCRRGVRAKLTPETMEYIKKRKKEGVSNRKIARELGITHTPVGNFLRGISWT